MIKKPKRLENLLGYSLNELDCIINSIDQYYYEDIKIKKNGKKRILHPSIAPLKCIQTKIKNNILNKLEYATFLHGGMKKKNNITNAVQHLGKKYHFGTDLKNFFPSITYKQVYQMFINNNFSSDVSRILTRLTTYQFKLPQGAPTSTHIANLVFMPIGLKLIEICEEEDIIFTSFIDDLTFSAQKDFKDITPYLLEVIEESGFQISHHKTFYKIGPATITGINTQQNVLSTPKKLFDRMKDSNEPEQTRKGIENYHKRVKSKGK